MAEQSKGALRAPPDDALGAPKRFSLIFPYGFVDAEGVHRFWRAGQPVVGAKDIGLLRARGVVLKED